jgi:hypothetical protein
MNLIAPTHKPTTREAETNANKMTVSIAIVPALSVRSSIVLGFLGMFHRHKNLTFVND